MSIPMKQRTGITENTYNRLATDSGVVIVDYGEVGERVIGATRGGNQFVIEDENREMIADGAAGPIKGSQRRIKSTAKLTVNLLELTTDNFKLNLPGAESVVDGNSEKITRDCQITAGDYLDNLTLLVAKNNTSEPLVFKLKNALCLNGLDFSASEDDETVITMEFTAHFDPNDLATEPWEVFNPSETPVVLYTLTYAAGTNGSLIGDTIQSVESGTDGTGVFADADDTFVFDQWSDAVTDNPRTDLAVSGDINVTANFVSV